MDGEKDNKREEVMNKVSEFEKKLNGIIEDRTCSPTNPFVKNVSDLIYYYIPEYEYLFKYFLLNETVKAIIELSQPDLINEINQTQNISKLLTATFKSNKRLFNSPSTDNDQNPKILWYICEILNNYSVETDSTILNNLKNEFGQNNATSTTTNENPSSANGENEIQPPNGGASKEAKEAEEVCFVNSKKEREIENQLLTDKITKEQISIDVDGIITDQVNRVSRYLIDQSKRFNKKQERKIIDEILHTYTYNYNEIDTGVSEPSNAPPFVSYIQKKLKTIFKKPNTSFKVIVIQSIKTYIINIVQTIITTLKQQTHPIYSLCLFLLVLLQDNTIKGYINRISSTREYLFYVRRYNDVRYEIKNHEAQRGESGEEYPHYADLETPTLCLCISIYNYLKTDVSIKPPSFINLEGIANKLRHQAVSLFNTFKRRIHKKAVPHTNTNPIAPAVAAVSNNSLIDVPTIPTVGGAIQMPAMKAPKMPSMFSSNKTKTEQLSEESDINSIQAPVPSEFSKYSPINQGTKLKTGKYIDSIKGFVQTKINNMNFSDVIKRRFDADANDLRMTLLYCIFELIDTHFCEFLLVLFKNDIADVSPIPKPEPNAIASKIPQKEFIVNDVLYKMFLLKMISDINNPENKLNEEILNKYIYMVSQINTTSSNNTPNIKQNTIDIAHTLQIFESKKSGGGNRSTRKRRPKPTTTTRTKLRKSKKQRYSSRLLLNSTTRRNRFSTRSRFTRKK